MEKNRASFMACQGLRRAELQESAASASALPLPLSPGRSDAGDMAAQEAQVDGRATQGVQIRNERLGDEVEADLRPASI